jgi:hypothetical protein
LNKKQTNEASNFAGRIADVRAIADQAIAIA